MCLINMSVIAAGMRKKFPFEHSNFLFCPILKNTDKEFECTREISSEHVIQEIRKLEKLRMQARLSDKI